MPIETYQTNVNIERPRNGQVQNLLREFVFIFFDRMRLIFTIFFVVFIITTAVALLIPSVYQSTAKFSLIVPQPLDPLQQETYFDYKNKVRRFIEDQKELIFSARVLQKVADQFPSRSGKKGNEAVDELRKNLEVTPPAGETFENVSVYYLTFQDYNPARATRIADAIANAYLATYDDMAKSKSSYSHEFFKEQTKKLYETMRAKERELRDYEIKKALTLIEILNLEPNKTNVEVGPNALLTQFLGKYHDLQQELAGIQISIEAMEKELKNKEMPVVLPEMEVTGRAVTVFKSKVAQLQIQLNEMKPQFKDNFIPVQQVEKELNLTIGSLRKELERTVRAQKITAQSIEGRLRELENVIEKLKVQIQSIAQERSVYDHLKQEYAIVRDSYVHASNQLEQSRLSLALNQEKQTLTLMDKPVVPTKPFKPNRVFIIIIGLVAGIFMGIASALTVDNFDHSIKTPQSIERNLEISVIGSLPKAL